MSSSAMQKIRAAIGSGSGWYAASECSGAEAWDRTFYYGYEAGLVVPAAYITSANFSQQRAGNDNYSCFGQVQVNLDLEFNGSGDISESYLQAVEDAEMVVADIRRANLHIRGITIGEISPAATTQSQQEDGQDEGGVLPPNSQPLPFWQAPILIDWGLV